MRPLLTSVALIFSLSVLAPTVAQAEDKDYVLTIKNHRFDPAELTIPADERVQLTIDNQDPTPEEFESRDLRVEKVITGDSKGTVWVGPLPAGEYSFVGEFHEDTAQGKLIAE